MRKLLLAVSGLSVIAFINFYEPQTTASQAQPMTETEFNDQYGGDAEASRIYEKLLGRLHQEAPFAGKREGSWTTHGMIGNHRCYVSTDQVYFSGFVHPEKGVNIPSNHLSMSASFSGSFELIFSAYGEDMQFADIAIQTSIGKMNGQLEGRQQLTRGQMSRLSSYPVNFYYDGKMVGKADGGAVIKILDECNYDGEAAYQEFQRYMHARYLDYLSKH